MNKLRNTSLVALVALVMASCGGDGDKAGIELKTEKQKTSYIVGADHAHQLMQDPGFSQYDKKQIIAGFEEGLKNKDAFGMDCQQTLQQMFAQGSVNPGYVTEGSLCIGKLLGVRFVEGWKQENFLSRFDLEFVKNGFVSALDNADTLVPKSECETTIRGLIGELNEKLMAKSMKEENAFFSKVKQIKGVREIQGGIFVETIAEGKGGSPEVGGDVSSHYVLMSPKGDTLQSTLGSAPVPFSLNQVVQGWAIAFPTLKKGGKYRLYVPQGLAYGANPPQGSGIPAFSPLVFYVELVDFGKPGTLVKQRQMGGM